MTRTYTDMSSIRRIVENISKVIMQITISGAFSLMAIQKGAKEVHQLI